MKRFLIFCLVLLPVFCFPIPAPCSLLPAPSSPLPASSLPQDVLDGLAALEADKAAIAAAQGSVATAQAGLATLQQQIVGGQATLASGWASNFSSAADTAALLKLLAQHYPTPGPQPAPAPQPTPTPAPSPDPNPVPNPSGAAASTAIVIYDSSAPRPWEEADVVSAAQAAGITILAFDHAHATDVHNAQGWVSYCSSKGLPYCVLANDAGQALWEGKADDAKLLTSAIKAFAGKPRKGHWEQRCNGTTCHKEWIQDQ